MLGFLATLLCGGIIVKEDLHRSRITQGNKAKAIKNGDAVYFDDVKSTFRATKTDEVVVHRCRNRKDEDVGIKTGRIYKSVDHNKEWENRIISEKEERNAYLKKNHMNFYMKRMPSWDYIDYRGGRHIGYAQIDKENGKPIWFIRSYDNGKTYEIQYGCYEKRGIKSSIINGKTVFDCRKISKEEYYDKYWLAYEEN